MRFLVSVLSAALYFSSSVSADCVPVTGSSVNLPDVEPNANALTMFVTDDVWLGSLIQSGGLSAADQLCTTAAAQSTVAKATYNRNAASQTVAFTAILSTSSVSAYSRIPAGIAIKSFDNVAGTNFDCVAVDRDELYKGGFNTGYFNGLDLDGEIFKEDGVAPGPDTIIWSGTGVPPTGQNPATNQAATATASSFGGQYFTAGTTPVPTDFSTVKATSFCSDWTTSDGTGAIGVLRGTTQNNQPGPNTWFQAPVKILGCNTGYHLMCISSQAYAGPTPTPTVTGDPQFSGLQGQSFQVHGMPEEFFNLITTPTFQLNSRFTYLASGNCNYNNTACWTHPGTYVDQLGFMFPGLQIKAVAGPHHKGLRVWINDEEMVKSAGRLAVTTTTGVNATEAAEVIVSHPHHDTLTVSFPLFTFSITNSDWFFNFGVSFHEPTVLAAGRTMHFIQDTRSATAAKLAATAHYLPEGINQVYPAYPMHGLVGQTWKNARYAGKRMYQGDVDDYMMLDHSLFSTAFVYNLYAY